MKQYNYIVYDLETSSADPHNCYMLQVAAVVLDHENLEKVDGGIFSSFMRPSHISSIDDINNDPNFSNEALEVNGINKRDILDFPDEKIVWKNFVEFCLKYAVGKSEWDRAVPVFYNGINFDRIISDRYTQLYKSKRPFHKTICIDVMMDMFMWVESLRGEKQVDKLSFDYLCRDYLGLARANESDGATHNAVRDTMDLVDVFVRFQRWKRKLAEKAKLKGSMKLIANVG